MGETVAETLVMTGYRAVVTVAAVLAAIENPSEEQLLPQWKKKKRSNQELLHTNGYIGSNIGIEQSSGSSQSEKNSWDGDTFSHFGFIQVGRPNNQDPEINADRGVRFKSNLMGPDKNQGVDF